MTSSIPIDALPQLPGTYLWSGGELIPEASEASEAPQPPLALLPAAESTDDPQLPA